MKIKWWYFVLVAVGFWLIPWLTLCYLIIGLLLKIGHMVLKEDETEDKNEQIYSPTLSDLVLDFYHIVTWLYFVRIVGVKPSLVIMSCGLLILSFLGSLQYWLGANYDVPDSLTTQIKNELVLNNDKVPVQVKSELISRIDNGFVYSDLVWTRDHLILSVNTSHQLLTLIAKNYLK